MESAATPSLLLLLTLSAAALSVAESLVVLSGLASSSALPGFCALELWNSDELEPADVTAHSLGLVLDGGWWSEASFSLSADGGLDLLGPGETWVLCSPAFATFMRERGHSLACSATSARFARWDGNDAVGVFVRRAENDGVPVDSFGAQGPDPGPSGWLDLVPGAGTRDALLLRRRGLEWTRALELGWPELFSHHGGTNGQETADRLAEALGNRPGTPAPTTRAPTLPPTRLPTRAPTPSQTSVPTAAPTAAPTPPPTRAPGTPVLVLDETFEANAGFKTDSSVSAPVSFASGDWSFGVGTVLNTNEWSSDHCARRSSAKCARAGSGGAIQTLFPVCAVGQNLTRVALWLHSFGSDAGGTVVVSVSGTEVGRVEALGLFPAGGFTDLAVPAPEGLPCPATLRVAVETSHRVNVDNVQAWAV